MEENGYKMVRDFLGSLQDQIGYGCTVSYSVGPNGPKGLISFHESGELSSVQAVEVDFDEYDFTHEEETTDQIVSYMHEYVEKILDENSLNTSETVEEEAAE